MESVLAHPGLERKRHRDQGSEREETAHAGNMTSGHPETSSPAVPAARRRKRPDPVEECPVPAPLRAVCQRPLSCGLLCAETPPECADLSQVFGVIEPSPVR